MAVIPEACHATRLGFVGIDREGIVITPPGMNNMIGTASDRASAPAIDEIEDQRRLYANRRMQP